MRPSARRHRSATSATAPHDRPSRKAPLGVRQSCEGDPWLAEPAAEGFFAGLCPEVDLGRTRRLPYRVSRRNVVAVVTP